MNASPGAAVGQVYFDADKAEQMAKEEKQDTIMVRPFTKPDDVHGMIASKGVLTSEGGATSHAAVVARQFGIPCVVGASAIKIDLERRIMTVGEKTVREGEWISVDGTTGQVFVGKIPTISPSLEQQTELLTLLTWADEICARKDVREAPAKGYPTRGLQVWANADYPKDAQRARSYGAVGIGLCRTEHMFFEPERLPIVQEMILSETGDGRTEALNKLLPYQRKDFDGLFEAMNGYPVIIRLIDPPLHEFMPDEEKLLEEVITMRVKGETDGLKAKEDLLVAIKGMHESNPMMGMRGVRLSISMPEIVEMQVRAIFEAAADCTLRGIVVKPEVMIPLTGTVKELEWIQPRLERIATAVMGEKNVKFDYKFGTMIEIPRAAVTAGEVAKRAEFFSFGTNDLTQMTYGYSRDDAERNFLITYQEQGILETNPFQSLDRGGVGKLMDWAISEGRKTRPEPGSGHLRRTRRRPELDRVVPYHRQQLRLLLAVPCADRPPGRGACSIEASPCKKDCHTEEESCVEVQAGQDNCKGKNCTGQNCREGKDSQAQVNNSTKNGAPETMRHFLFKKELLLNVDHLSNIDQVGVLDIRVQPQQAFDRGAEFIGDDPQRIASLHDIGRHTGGDGDRLSNIDHVRVADLRVDPQEGIHGGAEFGCNACAGCRRAGRSRPVHWAEAAGAEGSAES